MVIAIPNEVQGLEKRVALPPSQLSPYIKAQHTMLVQSGAGLGCGYTDEMYASVGATIVKTTAELMKKADLLFKVDPPVVPAKGKNEYAGLKKGAVVMGYFSPFVNLSAVGFFAKHRITTFGFELVPRITRAQNMDALSSMATLAGYKAVLLAANQLKKIFPLMMTAAGTISPANVLVLGAGVAGLQAIATAKRLGAKVFAYDPRPEVKEQVHSVGGTFIDITATEGVSTSGGYAKEQSKESIERQKQMMSEYYPKMDAVITTAQVFGKKAPVLISKEMVGLMKAGSVIVDLAAAQGGNCEVTVGGKTVLHKGVSVIGALNLPATLPVDASLLLGKNFTNLFNNTFKADGGAIDWNDEITIGACITHDGEVRNVSVRDALQTPDPERKKK